jgi:tRNA (mo5U34)-methyltransferase
MTKEEITAELERLQPWFHSIDLGQGIRTKTASAGSEPVDHPRESWEIIKKYLPENLTGKSVLDVGCNAGFYAVEAKRRGASRVVGVDTQRLHIRQANFVKRVLGLDIDFKRMSVYALTPHEIGQFDVTLALGLIYHCKHLFLALEKLFQVTKETLILETAIAPAELLPDPVVYGVGGLKRTLHPLLYVDNPASHKEPVYNWFLPSPSSLQAICKNIGFDEVDIVTVRNNRAVLVCRKKEAYADSHVLSHLAAELTLIEGSESCRASERLRYRIQAENSGMARWLAARERETEKATVNLGAHLLRADEEIEVWDYGRASLKRDVNPGETVVFDITLTAPAVAGIYHVEFDMVSEQLAWFEELGVIPLKVSLEVT